MVGSGLRVWALAWKPDLDKSQSFSPIFGFTAYSERSGEEAAYTLMRSLLQLMDEAVREHGGVARGFTSDGIMAVLGALVALEDVPLPVCRAAL